MDEFESNKEKLGLTVIDANTKEIEGTSSRIKSIEGALIFHEYK